MSPSRPGRTPYWPDRSALRRRRNARRAFWLLAVLVLVLPWFGYQHVRDWLRPGADANRRAVDGAVESMSAQVIPAGSTEAGAPLVAKPAGDAGNPDGDADNPDGDAAAGLDAIDRDARAGDGAAAVARLADLGAEVHRQVLLADRGSAIRREAARRDVADIPGVRAAGWVDRMTMLLVMASRGTGHATIAEACRRLGTHGDVAGLAVRVQEVAGDQVSAGALLGECRPGNGASAGGGPMQPFPGAPLRAAQGGAEADDEDPEAADARRRRAEESLRILSETTPELPTAPQPRVDP
ncbi:hypothetical protein [Luteimonas sp. MC1750]|uniref:hypothetical protein n=1 Tax=Luteimonas sp. MC1750 TaxID=2799326 RepID=UPI0018F0EB62|nr:hypothetical protein [Luteimonas sp. MC1750]MBJ6984452.1 hypothetical protein [Luteimonas sp. MC1750]QQO04934.1 hypothetical protein JGR68_08545 [Luteimonas sp. MC1750]